MKRLPLILIILVGGVAIWWLVSNSRAATESAAYRVIRTDGKFEVREYPSLKTVRTGMPEANDNDPSFGKLFRYITGANEKTEKIAMTTPVIIERPAGEREGAMSFVLPENVANNGVPAPKESGVRLDTRPAAQFVVYRFPGTMKDEPSALETLRNWVKAQGISTEGEPVFLYYDPPWTPAPLRRNEVMLRMAAGG